MAAKKKPELHEAMLRINRKTWLAYRKLVPDESDNKAIIRAIELFLKMNGAMPK